MEKKKNVEYGDDIKEITTKEIINIIKTRIPRGVFYSNENKMFIGIDNRSGGALVEEFDTREDCISWLMYGDDDSSDID